MSDSIIKEIESISNKDELMKHMSVNAEYASLLYRKAIELKCQNEQFFMDWQDSLNKVSYVSIEDL